MSHAIISVISVFCFLDFKITCLNESLREHKLTMVFIHSLSFPCIYGLPKVKDNYSNFASVLKKYGQYNTMNNCFELLTKRK